MTDTAAPQKVPALHITDTDFEKVMTEAGDKPVLVDFYAEWCGPCRLAAPIIEELADVYKGKAVIVKMDVDKCDRAFIQTQGVMSIPTVKIFKAGKEVDRQTGFMGREKYAEMIDNALKE
jgi:thioredoxin 1